LRKPGLALPYLAARMESPRNWLISWNRCTLMFAISSCRHRKTFACISSIFSMAATGQGRRHDHETTIDHALMRGLITAGPDTSRSFLGLVSSVGLEPADSTSEGSPGRDRASSLAQLWICCCLLMSSVKHGLLLLFADHLAGVCLAIAQIKPESSRAIAAMTTFGSLPARRSMR
jgi:hypothetical protein